MAERFSKYEIEAEVGAGAFGTVYRARDTTLGRLVALKLLDPLLMRDKRWVERFHREAQAMARLDHPNIVTVYEIEEYDGRLYIAMQYVDGPNLGERLKEGGPLPWDEALQVTREVAAGLDHAHAEGVLHRDLKPENIILGPKGAVLTDFGIAQLVGESRAGSTLSGGVVGTPNYIAPEIWNGEPSTAAADIYALACIISEMLTGKRLYDGPSTPAVMHAHFQPPTLPEAWPEGVPDRLNEVLARALAQEWESRHSSAGEAAEILSQLGTAAQLEIPGVKAALQEEPTDEQPPASVYSAANPPLLRRLRWPLAGMSTLVAGISALLVCFLFIWGASALFGGENGTLTPAYTSVAAATGNGTPTSIRVTEVIDLLPTSTSTPYRIPTTVSSPTPTSSPTPSHTPTTVSSPTLIPSSTPFIIPTTASLPASTNDGTLPQWLFALGNHPVIPGQSVAGIDLGDSIEVVRSQIGNRTRAGASIVRYGPPQTLTVSDVYEYGNHLSLRVLIDAETETVVSLVVIDYGFNELGYIASLAEGVGIGSSRELLVAALGESDSTDGYYNESCPGENKNTESLSYSGITFWICDGNGLVYALDIH